MSFGEDPGHGENLRVQSQQQALQAMLQSSVNAYVRMLNSAALFPFLLYQQSLATANRVAWGGLNSASRVSRQGTQEEAGVDRPARGAEETLQSVGVAASQAARQDVEVDEEIAQDNAEAPVQDTRDLQQNVEVAGETQVSGTEVPGRSLPEVDEGATGLSDPVSSPSSKASEESNTVDELPDSPALPDEPTARAVYEADRGSVESSGRAEVEIDEAAAGPSSTSASPDREESIAAEEPPPTDGVTGLSPPPEVPDVELPPPPLVPSSILDELPQSQDEKPTAQSVRGEKPRIHVRKGTAAARRTAEELNVDLDEVEGTGQNGQITVGDVRKKAAEKKP